MGGVSQGPLQDLHRASKWIFRKGNLPKANGQPVGGVSQGTLQDLIG
jgi:hypothetical protein